MHLQVRCVGKAEEQGVKLQNELGLVWELHGSGKRCWEV